MTTQTMREYFDAFDGMIFVQKDGPNTIPEPMPCVNIDGVDQPQGDVVRRLCRTGDGGYETANVSQGIPSSATFDVTLWKMRRRDPFQRAMERKCMIPVYVAHGLCAGRQDNILSWDELEIYMDPYVTTKAKSNLAQGQHEEGDTPEMVGLSYSLSADPTVHELYKLVTTTVTVGTTEAEDEPLRDITTCTIPRCPLVGCGAPMEPCDEIHVVADSAASPATAEGYQSVDNAASFDDWTTSPFGAADPIVSIICVQIDADTERLIVANGAAGTASAEIAYSDNGGATWTIVAVGASATEYANHSGALFALDYRHIWLCTNEANVWFSSDGGLTWTDQNAPVPAASEGLFYIHFVDANFGWAVGGFRTTPTGLFIQTVDGGEHWALATAEPKVERGNCVAVQDANNVWVGLDDGTVYYTQDWGATWTQRTLPSTLANIADIQFVDHYVGALCGYKTGSGHGVATVMRTFDGGYTWEEYNLATEFDAAVEQMGVNALLICDVNEIHAVTEDIGAGSLVWTLKPTGWT